MTEFNREPVIGVRHKGRTIQVEKYERPILGVRPLHVQIVYDGFSDGALTQKAKSAEDIMRWLSNALEDGS